jgi:hypothetical protein
MSAGKFRPYIEQHYKRDKSAAEIARDIHKMSGETVSRNAVIGQARRMHLTASRETALNPARPNVKAITLPFGQFYDPNTRRLSPKWPEPLPEMGK